MSGLATSRGSPGPAAVIALAMVVTSALVVARKGPSGGASDEQAVAAEPRASARLGLAIPSHVHAVAWVGRDAGFFERESLDVEVQVLGGSAAAVQALIAGAVDVVLAGGDAALKANSAGADVVVVAGLVHRFYHQLVARRSTVRVADLRGKRVGLPFPGGPQDMAVRHALRSAGLAPEADVEIASLGKDVNLLAALARGDVEAAPAQVSPKTLEKLGLHVLADPTSGDVEFPYAMVVVRRDDLAKRRALIESMVAALCSAAAFYRAPANDAAVRAIVSGHLGGKDDTDVAERLENAGRRFLTLPPVPRRSALESAWRLSGVGPPPAGSSRSVSSVAAEPATLPGPAQELVGRTVDEELVPALVRAGRCASSAIR